MITPNTNAHIASPMYNFGVVSFYYYSESKGCIPFPEEATRTCRTVVIFKEERKTKEEQGETYENDESTE